MNPGLIFLFAGIALVWVGMTRLSVVSFFPISLGVAFFGVGVCFVTRSPRYFFKRKDGRLSIVSYLLFWPYHVLNWISLWTFRTLSNEAAYHEIVPGLFLGRRLVRSERSELTRLGAVSVLDLTCEFGEVEFLRRAPAYLCIPLLDRTRPSRAELEQGIAFIRERLQSGPVYVHCAMGHGRSATFVIGYLLSAGIETDLNQAIERVRNKRPGVGLYPEQRRSLEEMNR